jgi:hypothetical protein
MGPKSNFTLGEFVLLGRLPNSNFTPGALAHFGGPLGFLGFRGSKSNFTLGAFFLLEILLNRHFTAGL